MNIKKILIVVILIGLFLVGRYIYHESGVAGRSGEFVPYGQTAYQGMDEHFKHGTVTVHRVYPYSGPSSYEPYSYARIVAVDIEFENMRQGIDLDDLDIIDANTLESFGSDPDMIGLSLDGQTMLDPFAWPEDLTHFRGLFIYIVRKQTTSIRIGYWGHFVTQMPVPIAEGDVLPVEPTEDDVYFTGSL